VLELPSAFGTGIEGPMLKISSGSGSGTVVAFLVFPFFDVCLDPDPDFHL